MEKELYKKAISVSEPPAEAFEFVPPNDLILTPADKYPLRNIFSIQPYLPFEIEKLSRLKSEISKCKLTIPSDWDDAFLLRIVHGSGYKTRKALKDFKKTVAAYKSLVPSDIKLLYRKVMKTLKTGFLYIHGRDVLFRPSVIFDCTKIDLKKFQLSDYTDATVFLMQFVINFMLIPGKVENWVNLVEMNKQGLTELPIKSIMKMSETLQDVFKCRLGSSYIINPPSSIYYIWKIFRPFLDKVTQSKIVIVKEGLSKQVLDLYNPCELEKRFGGNAENLTEYWPPVFPKHFQKTIPKIKVKKEKHVKSLENSREGSKEKESSDDDLRVENSEIENESEDIIEYDCKESQNLENDEESEKEVVQLRTIEYSLENEEIEENSMSEKEIREHVIVDESKETYLCGCQAGNCLIY